LGFGVLLALLAVLSVVVLSSLGDVKRQFSFVVEHDVPLIANAQLLAKLVVDMEAGQRGFVITGNEEFLQPYHEGMTEFEKILEIEKEMVSDNPAQVRALEKIEGLVDEWQDQAAKPEIAMRRSFGLINAEKLLAELHSSNLELYSIQNNMQQTMAAVQESFAYIVSGQEIEKDEFLEWAGKLDVTAENFRRLDHLDSPEEEFEKGIFERIVSEQLNLVSAAKVMFNQSETKDSVSTKVFYEYEDIVDKLSADFAKFIDIEKAEVLEAQNRAAVIIRAHHLAIEEKTGKSILDRIRVEFKKFIQVENALTAKRYTDASETAESAKDITIILSIVSIIFGVVIATFITKAITIPVYALLDAVKVTAKGDLTSQIEITSKDEIGQLATAFNKMVTDLRRLAEERKSGESKLLARERQFRLFTDNVPALIASLDLDRRYRLVNQKYAEWFGLRTEQVIGRHARDILGESAYQNVEAHIEKVLNGEQTEFEAQVSTKNGQRWILATYVPEIGNDDTVKGFYALISDIDDRKRAEDGLRASEQRYARAAEIAQLGYWRYDLDTKVVIWSNEVCAIFGVDLNAQDPTYESFLNYVHPDDKAMLDNPVDMGVSDEEKVDIEYRIVRPDGVERTVHSVTEAQYDCNGKAIALVGTMQDITERKQLEKQISDIHEGVQHKIGHDLHDSLGQHLTGLAFRAKVFQLKLQAKSLPEADEAADIVALANQAISQTRSLARGLYPVLLEVEGLESALSELTTGIGNLFGIRCYFKSDLRVNISANGKAVHLYRIAQEAINNAINHGKAKQIWVELATVNEKSVMKIKNDGHDFPENPQRKQGMGLAIMNYRARMINASLAIHRDVNGGTAVTCTFSCFS